MRQHPPHGPVSQGLRLFFCGHSYHFHMPTMLEELAWETLGHHPLSGVSGA